MTSAPATGAVFALRVEGYPRGLLLDSASGPGPDADIALVRGCDDDAGNPGRDRGCADVDFLMEGDWYAEGAGLVPICSCD